MLRLFTVNSRCAAALLRIFLNLYWRLAGRRMASGIALIGLLMASGCERKSETYTESPRPVNVVELKSIAPECSLRLTGTVEPWAEEDVAFEVAGRVTYTVEPGLFSKDVGRRTVGRRSPETSWQRLITNRSEVVLSSGPSPSRRGIGQFRKDLAGQAE